MNSPKAKGQVFRLHWVLDLVSDSSRCYISLLFKNLQTGYVLIDTIPPELLSYCTVGTYFLNGKKFNPRHPDGMRREFTINSTSNNQLIDAGEAFSDAEYNLSLNEKLAAYSIVSKKQSCFVQQVGDTKIIIPSFVIASAYYFKSSSLRHAILSRRLDSLFRICDIDRTTRHARIELKTEGNLSDAKTIARFKHDDFANKRLNQCINHLYAIRYNQYKRLKFDIPFEQELSIKARGVERDNPAGGKTFIAYQILREDSRFPFNSLDVIYEKHEEEILEDVKKFPATRTKHNGRKSERSPSENLVRHLLASSDKIDNENEKKIRETKIAVKIPPAEKTLQIVHDERQTELSFQPGSMNDQEVSPGDLREKDDAEKTRHASSLNQFRTMADPLDNHIFTIKSDKEKISVQVTNYNYSEDLVCKREQGEKHLTLKESYDHTPFNRRRCAYVFFRFHGRHVCLVEIDQEGLPSSGCSTMVLISAEGFDKEIAESVVKGFVENKTIAARAKVLARKGIILKTKNHPPAFDEETLDGWRTLLLQKVLEG